MSRLVEVATLQDVLNYAPGFRSRRTPRGNRGRVQPKAGIPGGGAPPLDPTLIGWFRADQGITQANSFLAESSFDSASWAKSNATVTANDTTDSDGGSEADLITDDAVSGAHGVIQSAGTTGFVATLRVRAKMNTRRWLAVLANGGLIVRWFDLQLGALGSLTDGSGNHLESTVEDEGNGWFLCTVRFNMTNAQSQFRLAPGDGGATTYSGSGDSLWLYKAELLQRTSAWADQTSYGNNLTQAAIANSPIYGGENWNSADPTLQFDKASSHFFEVTSGSLATLITGEDVEWTVAFALRLDNVTGAGTIFSWGNAATENMLCRVSHASGGTQLFAQVRNDAGLNLAQRNVTPILGTGTLNFIVVARLAGSLRCFTNGVDTSPSGFTTPFGVQTSTKFSIGVHNRVSKSEYLGGAIPWMKVYNRALDSTEAEALRTECKAIFSGLP